IRVRYGATHPAALLSRGVAGIAGKSVVYTLPGSVRAVREYLEEILRTLEHTILMQYGIDTHGNISK
ncbi:MAG: molybdenum cofactor synthesis protein, partial [Bacteroidetes bacterium]|nr:molybdenum cofactor synthesis protein [Bacteroidota bacterium]